MPKAAAAEEDAWGVKPASAAKAKSASRKGRKSRKPLSKGREAEKACRLGLYDQWRAECAADERCRDAMLGRCNLPATTDLNVLQDTFDARRCISDAWWDAGFEPQGFGSPNSAADARYTALTEKPPGGCGGRDLRALMAERQQQPPAAPHKSKSKAKAKAKASGSKANANAGDAAAFANPFFRRMRRSRQRSRKGSRRAPSSSRAW
jgi:hypothetical protein